MLAMNGAQRIQSGGGRPCRAGGPRGVDSLSCAASSPSSARRSSSSRCSSPSSRRYSPTTRTSSASRRRRSASSRLSTRWAASSARIPSGLLAVRAGRQDDRPHRPRDHRGHERRVRPRRERLGPVRRPLRPGCRERVRLDGRPRVAHRRGAQGTPRRADRHRHGLGDRRGAPRPGAGRVRVRRRPSDRLRGRSRGGRRARGLGLGDPRRTARRGAATAERPRGPHHACGRSSPASGSSRWRHSSSESISVVAPLRLDELGWGALGISAAFLISAGIEAALSPVFGRWSDRHGRLAPVRTGLVAAIAVSLVLPWVDLPWPYLVLVICAGVAYGVNWVPGTALLSDGAEKAGLDQGFGFALLNVAWAPANVVGAALGGVLAQAAGDAAAYLLAAALCLGTLAAAQLAVFGAQRRPGDGDPRAMDLFWHDDALRHDTGERALRATALAAPRRARAAPGERGARPQHEGDPRARPARRRTSAAATGGTRPSRSCSLVHDEAYVESVREFCLAGGGVLTWSTPVSAAPGMRRSRPPGRRWPPARRSSPARPRSPTRSSARPATTPSRPRRTATASSTTSRSRPSTRAAADRPRGDPRLGRPSRQRDAGVLLRARRRPHRVAPHAPRRLERRAPPDRRARRAREGAGSRLQRQRRAPAGNRGRRLPPRLRGDRRAVVDRFDPGLVLVACGQDANQFDPNGRQCVSMEGFRRLGRGHAGARGASHGRPGGAGAGGRLSRAPTRPSASTPPWPACSESRAGSRIPAPTCLRTPATRPPELAVVKAALAPYWSAVRLRLLSASTRRRRT